MGIHSFQNCYHSKYQLILFLKLSLIYGFHSVMGANKAFLQSKLYMEEMNVYDMWKQKVNSESNEVRMSVQIRELCEWRDKCDYTFLTKDECQTIINGLCTN